MVNEQCDLPSFRIISERQFLGVLCQNEMNARDFATFCHCCRSTGDNIEMLESLAECGRLGNYDFILCCTQTSCYISWF